MNERNTERRMTADRLPTVVDVAREAGVSKTTVSRVLSRARPVTPESAAAVLSAAERVGYRVNPIAQSLRTRSTRSMGLIVPNLTNPFFGAVAQAAAASLTQQGWHLLMADLDDRPGREAEQAEWLRSYRVDAVLMIPVSLQAPDGLSRVTCPLVQIDRWVPVPDSVIVRTDDHEGVRLLVDHLRATGRHRLAFIGADPTSSSARLRLDSFREYAGMGRPVLLGDYSAQWGRRAAEVLLETVGDTDAVVCANDLIALGVIQVLIENGLRVPADLAVTGFDDIVFAELSHPALTTIRQPVAQLASAAVEAAMTLIRGEDLEHRDLVLPPELVVRGSAPGGS